MHARFRVLGVTGSDSNFLRILSSSGFFFKKKSRCHMFQVGGGGRECPFWEDFKNYYSSGRGEALPRSPLGKCSISAPQTPNPVACVPRMGASVGLKTYPLVGGRNLPTYYPDLEKEKKHRSRAGKKNKKGRRRKNIDPRWWKNILHVCGSWALFVAISRSATTRMHLRSIIKVECTYYGMWPIMNTYFNGIWLPLFIP